MRMPKAIQPHKVSIKEYEGDGAYGPVYSDPYNSTGYFQEERKVVKNKEGNEVVSDAQYYTSDDISPPTESIITFNGVDHEVLQVAPRDNALTGKTNHVEVVMI